MSKRIWITWEDQRRNRELSRAFDADLIELKEIDRIPFKIKKYCLGLVKTVLCLLQKRPSIVFCQNPSIILSFFLVVLKYITGFKVIVDAHNAGLLPAEGRSSMLMLISKLIQRQADLVLVTNNYLKKHVMNSGGKAFVLQDKIPLIKQRSPIPLAGKINFLFICSYAEDEPYEIVFEAAASLPDDIKIYVTGNFKNKINITNLPKQVHLTGFIPAKEFETMLYSVDGTIDLTKRENCLVCGAYESVAVGKPMILSNTIALKEYFKFGAIYTNHTPEAIHNAILNFISKKETLKKEVQDLKLACQQDWSKRKFKLENHLSNL